jgi:protein-disulfide isomerase
MASGKQARRQRQAATARVPAPPRRGGVGARRASPRVLLAAGIALVLVIVGVTLGLTLTGKKSGKGNTAPATVNADLAPVAGVQQHGLVLGNPFARVTLTEYVDTSCPICQEYVTTTFPTIATQYVRTGKVKVEARVVAFVGPSSARGRELVLAAARQNKAWQLLELLYQNQGNESTAWLTDTLVLALAAKIPGLDSEQLLRDAASDAVATEATKMDGFMRTDGVTATPTFVLTTTDGKRHLLGAGNYPASAFASTFDRALKS